MPLQAPYIEQFSPAIAISSGNKTVKVPPCKPKAASLSISLHYIWQTRLQPDWLPALIAKIWYVWPSFVGTAAAWAMSPVQFNQLRPHRQLQIKSHSYRISTDSPWKNLQEESKTLLTPSVLLQSKKGRPPVWKLLTSDVTDRATSFRWHVQLFSVIISCHEALGFGR